MIPYPNQRFLWPNFRSPLAWDFFAISTYLTGSTIFLYLPTIPDFASVRDAATGIRKKIYSVLALGWQGTPRQWQRLQIAMHIMAIAIVPVAVSVHTIVSWDFSMTLVPMWHSSIFGPYTSGATRLGWGPPYALDVRSKQRGHIASPGPAATPTRMRTRAKSSESYPHGLQSGCPLAYGRPIRSVSPASPVVCHLRLPVRRLYFGI